MFESLGDKQNNSLKKGYTGRTNTEYNACGICASSDIHTYNIQHLIKIDTYIILITKSFRETIQPKAWYGKNVF